ncbi:MAG: gamma carbonic anhydrase family protein [Lachnospiraceae bacterium]|nr:gamma carbonic anhydrase family protein [Lachnospiraceae bacterium]
MTGIHETVFLAEGSRVVGNVTVGADCGIWYNAVIRADLGRCTIGKRSNIQDNCVLHMDSGFDVVIGDDVSVGHSAVLHGCEIGDNTVVGMGSVVLNGAKIGRNCLIGAGSVVTPGTIIPDGSLALGSPAKVRRALTGEEISGNRENANEYVELAKAAKAQA